MEAQPMDRAFALARGASAALRELLASMPTPSGDGVEPGSSDTSRRQAQIRRKGDALAAALIAYARCQKLSPQAIEVLPFLSSFASLLWHTFDRHISISVDVERDCPELFVDAAALEEALMQLAMNASSAMPRGGKLILRAVHDKQNRCLVCLEVTDNGVGMNPAVAAEAASPFFTSKEASPLSGMGLPAVAGFVAQSGGQMRISSAPGRGTTVRMLLPQVATARD